MTILDLMLRSHDQDRPVWAYEAEIPVSGDRLAHLLSTLGGFAVSAPSSSWSRTDVEVLMPEILRVAAATLKAQSFAIFVAHFAEGRPQSEVAETLGVSHQCVQQSLWGGSRPDGYWRKNGEHAPRIADRGVLKIGGSVDKVRKALAVDPGFQSAAKTLAASEHVAPAKALTWFLGICNPPKPHLFLPLAVLLVLDALADASGRTTLTDALGHLPRAALDHSLTTLRLLGYIETDGVAIRITKTPVDTTEESVG